MELHWEGSAPVACAAGLFLILLPIWLLIHITVESRFADIPDIFLILLPTLLLTYLLSLVLLTWADISADILANITANCHCSRVVCSELQSVQLPEYGCQAMW